jgi:hypothetical protein
VRTAKLELQRLKQAAEKVLFVIPSKARDLLFFSASKKQQIPRANAALRNDNVRVFPQPVKPHSFCKNYVVAKTTTHKDSAVLKQILKGSIQDGRLAQARLLYPSRGSAERRAAFRMTK